jgi:hypothetical protein
MLLLTWLLLLLLKVYIVYSNGHFNEDQNFYEDHQKHKKTLQFYKEPDSMLVNKLL